MTFYLFTRELLVIGGDRTKTMTAIGKASHRIKQFVVKKDGNKTGHQRRDGAIACDLWCSCNGLINTRNFLSPITVFN